MSEVEKRKQEYSKYGGNGGWNGGKKNILPATCSCRTELEVFRRGSYKGVKQPFVSAFVIPVVKLHF